MASSRHRGSRPRLSASWPLLLLGAAIIAMSVAAFQAVGATRSNQRAVVRLARDYAAFGAWTFARHASTEMHETAWRILGPIQHRYVHEDLRIPDASLLPRYLERSFDGKPLPDYVPATYFGFMLGSDTIKVVGAALPARTRRWIQDTIAVAARGRSAVDDGETYLLGGDRSRLIAFALMPTRLGAIAYGFVLDSVRLAAMLGGVLDRATLLPPSLAGGAGNREMLDVQVRAADGAPLFATGAWPATWLPVGTDRLAADMASLQVLAAVRPGLAPRLAIGGVPRSRLPLIVTLLVLALGLAVVAVAQIRREQALARLRSDFVASVSHELRTPLAQIRLYVETLRLGRVTTDEQREWSLATVDRETSRLAHLVENILSFARIDRGASAGPTGTLDLSREIDDVVRGFDVMAAARRARIERAIEPDLIATAARDAVRQIVINLLDNAVKFGPTGQTIRLRLARVGRSARLTIDDEGPGIAAAERDLVFAPFHRGSSRAAATVGGSGIGLAVVRDLVAAHAGRVVAAEAPGGGARLIVELPMVSESGGEVADDHRGPRAVGHRASEVVTRAGDGDSRFQVPDGTPDEMAVGSDDGRRAE